MNVVHDGWPRTSLFRHRAGNEVNEQETSSSQLRLGATEFGIGKRWPIRLPPDTRH
jgi:hypothetical protein